MKTPRDLLFEKHKSAEAQLNELRAAVVGQHTVVSPTDSELANGFVNGVKGLLRSLRWQFAGLATMWLLIASLHHVGNETPEITVVEDRSAAKPLIVAVAEHRRWLERWLQSNETNAPASSPIGLRRRSAIGRATSVA